jgi:hypothetical protein
VVLSRRLTPGQRLAALPLFVLGSLFSLAAGHMLAEHALQASAAARPPHTAHSGGSVVLAPTANPTPTATATVPRTTMPRTTSPAALRTSSAPPAPTAAAPKSDDGTGKSAAPKERPPVKGGHTEGKGHGSGHHGD